MKLYNSFLYLEPFVFLFLQDNYALLYDSLTFKSYKIYVNDSIRPLLKKLLKIENMYTIQLNIDELQDEYITNFILFIKSNYLGDVVSDQRCKVKPILFPPFLNFDQNKSDGVKERYSNVISNLSELTINLTNSCNQRCAIKCDMIKNQTLFCHKHNIVKYLDIDLLKLFISDQQIRHIPISLIGGNILEFPRFSEIIELFKDYEKVSLFVHYKNFKQIMTEGKLNNFVFVILIDYPVIEEELLKVQTYVLQNNIDATFKFIVNNINEYTTLILYLKNNPYPNSVIVPVYDGDINFFIDNVYISENDIQEFNLTKKDIYANQTVNINDFGKLIINCDGLVYANYNNPPIGNIINNNINELVLRCLGDNNTWLRTRTMKPCSDCLYQWLCPSPSNYDYVIGKSNLCQIID